MEGITLQQAVPMMPKRNQGATPLPIRSEAAGVTLPIHNDQPTQADLDVKIAQAEQRRVSFIKDIANKYVLGDTRLSMFYKDFSGQYVTRFVNLRDGKVTYIPEPSLMMSGSGGDRPSLSLEA